MGIGVGAPVSVAAGGSVEIGAGTGACFGVIPGLALTAYGVKTALKKYLI